jgi:HK97 family phage major capsid protein
MQMEAEVRRRLVAEALIRKVAMQTNVMSFPVNPEAGYGTWVTNAQFGTSNSSGAAATHQLKEVTLNTYKLATKEYMNFEEEEDSLIILLPIVRDAMVRRVARSVDKAVLLGAGAGADPIKGLAKYDDVSVVTSSVSGAFNTGHLRALRKDLGAWGLDPSEIVFIVNTEAYYDLMDDQLFQTMDKVGDRATILTGQVGMVGGTPVLVSSELPAKASGANTGGNTANVGAIAIAPANFMVGNQRGIRFDTDDNVENQQKVLVASLRMGMTQITTNQGQGVSAFRWLV